MWFFPCIICTGVVCRGVAMLLLHCRVLQSDHYVFVVQSLQPEYLQVMYKRNNTCVVIITFIAKWCDVSLICITKFRHRTFDLHSQTNRDTFILTTLDTFTSLIAGIIIFGILGNLAHETGSDDIRSVVKGGTGVAFVSYPDAISKMSFAPQLFAATFFFMLFVLAIGSNLGMSICLMTAIRDKFRRLSHARVAIGIATVQFCIGVVYTTEGGQFLLNLVDYFGVSMVVYVLAIAELLTFGWIYGVSRICKDAEFMLGIKTSWYWRICWGVVTPAMMIAILINQIVKYEPLKYNGQEYPVTYYGELGGLGVVG